jgi:hypothetical protein
MRNPNMSYPLMKDEDWVVVKNYDEFVKVVTERGLPDTVSFDHDLAQEHYPWGNPQLYHPAGPLPYEKYREKTGLDCAKWLVDYCIDHNLELPQWRVHSANPVGAQNIISYLDSFERIRNAKNLS